MLGASRARLAMYKASLNMEADFCPVSNILKALAEAMHDEVGVLPISLSSGGVLFMEIVEFDKRGLCEIRVIAEKKRYKRQLH